MVANVEEKRLVRLFHQLQDVDYELRLIPGSENYLAHFHCRSQQHSHSVLHRLAQRAVQRRRAHRHHALAQLRSRRQNLASIGPPVAAGLTSGQNCTLHSLAFPTWQELRRLSPLIRDQSRVDQVAPLQPIVISRPWQIVGKDFMGPFRTSRRGNVYIILAIDHLTKFAEGTAKVSFDAVTTANFLLIVCRHGMFEKMLSDQGVTFESNLLKQLCVLLGTTKLHTSTYHAARNCVTERLNKTIKPALAKFVNEEHDDFPSDGTERLQQLRTFYDQDDSILHRPSAQVCDVLLSNKLPFGTAPHTVSELVHGPVAR